MDIYQLRDYINEEISPHQAKATRLSMKLLSIMGRDQQEVPDELVAAKDRLSAAATICSSYSHEILALNFGDANAGDVVITIRDMVIKLREDVSILNQMSDNNPHSFVQSQIAAKELPLQAFEQGREKDLQQLKRCIDDANEEIQAAIADGIAILEYYRASETEE